MLSDEEIAGIYSKHFTENTPMIDIFRVIESLVRERTIDECAGLFEHEFFAEAKAAILALKEKKHDQT